MSPFGTAVAVGGDLSWGCLKMMQLLNWPLGSVVFGRLHLSGFIFGFLYRRLFLPFSGK